MDLQATTTAFLGTLISAAGSGDAAGASLARRQGPNNLQIILGSINALVVSID